MRSAKIATALGTAALIAAGALAIGAGTATATAPRTGCEGACKIVQETVVAPKAEGTWPIIFSGCHISEQVELQGSPAHDYMRWETTGNSSGCTAMIYRNGDLFEIRTINTTGFDASLWYYDGPGYTMQVCVENDNGQGACGPQN